MRPSHVSQSIAAKMLGTSRQMIQIMLKRAELSSIEFYGVKLIPTKEIEKKKTQAQP
jgi:transcriptional regulator